MPFWIVALLLWGHNLGIRAAIEDDVSKATRAAMWIAQAALWYAAISMLIFLG